MALNSLLRVTMGVPNPDETIAYYAEFGLHHTGNGRFSTLDCGEQLQIHYAAKRKLTELQVGTDEPDDLLRIATRFGRLGISHRLINDELVVHEPVAKFAVHIAVAPRPLQPQVAATPYNGPGRTERLGRAPGVTRNERVKPRKLGHVVLGTTDLATSLSFFTEGLGFKISDHIADKGVFLRCSVDHHNVLLLAAPVSFLHHTSWQVNDIDDIGRGAATMLEGQPERHVWGLGRHHAGSNFFWYLKDPAGNFSEYYSDMDCIPADELWEPEVFDGKQGLFNWGPPPPPSFLEPEDLAALMTDQHSS